MTEGARAIVIDGKPVTERFDHFLFLDYESTGEPDQKLLEVGWMLTDRHLDPLFDCQSTVIAQGWLNMSAKVLKMHTANGLLDEVAKTTTEVCDAEKLICDMIQPIAEDKNSRITLAGFSCHFDRTLMHRDMPQLDGWLHYRHFDVSVLRSAYHYWVENIPSKKDEHPHRVKADILASWQIARTYRGLFSSYFPKSSDIEGPI